MLQPWSHVFATPGRRLGCFILFFVCPIMGRPTIVGVRIPSRIVRIHRTRRTIRVVRVVPKTESRFSKPVFQPCSGRIQRSLSRWRTCPLHMDFLLQTTFKAGVGLRKGRPVLPWRRIWMCDCIALRWVAPCCTILTVELGQTHQRRRSHSKPERPHPKNAAHKPSSARRTENEEPLFGAQ